MRDQWHSSFGEALATAAAVAPDVAGPVTAATFDWVTETARTEAASSAVSDLLSLPGEL